MRFGGTSRVPYGLVVTVAAVLSPARQPRPPPPLLRCGGPRRDKPCTNPALKLSVTPTPEDAVLEASAACAPLTSKVAPAAAASAPGPSRRGRRSR